MGRKNTSDETGLSMSARLAQDKDLRVKIFKELCNHLIQGYSLNCFGPISEVTIMKLTLNYPNEFSKELIEEAQRKGQTGWEQIGRRQSTGDCMGNSRSWYYNMANRYGWRDKIDIDSKTQGQLAVTVVSYGDTKEPSQPCKSQDEL